MVARRVAAEHVAGPTGRTRRPDVGRVRYRPLRTDHGSSMPRKVCAAERVAAAEPGSLERWPPAERGIEGYAAFENGPFEGCAVAEHAATEARLVVRNARHRRRTPAPIDVPSKAALSPNVALLKLTRLLIRAPEKALAKPNKASARSTRSSIRAKVNDAQRPNTAPRNDAPASIRASSDPVRSPKVARSKRVPGGMCAPLKSAPPGNRISVKSVPASIVAS